MGYMTDLLDNITVTQLPPNTVVATTGRFIQILSIYDGELREWKFEYTKEHGLILFFDPEKKGW